MFCKGGIEWSFESRGIFEDVFVGVEISMLGKKCANALGEEASLTVSSRCAVNVLSRPCDIPLPAKRYSVIGSVCDVLDMRVFVGL